MNHHPATSWFIASSCVALLGAVGGVAVTMVVSSHLPASNETQSVTEIPVTNNPVRDMRVRPPTRESIHGDDGAYELAVCKYLGERAAVLMSMYKENQDPAYICGLVEGSEEFLRSVRPREPGQVEYNQAIEHVRSFYTEMGIYLKKATREKRTPSTDEFNKVVNFLMEYEKSVWMGQRQKQQQYQTIGVAAAVAELLARDNK